MFFDRLQARIDQLRAPCCVGLDPILEQIPLEHRAKYALKEQDTLLRLGQTGGMEVAAKCIGAWLINEVLPQLVGLVPAVKPQMAYFEQLGPEGMKELQYVTHTAKKMGFSVILDGKRGDIGSTSAAYAAAYLDPRISAYYADALTVAPYMGDDSVGPFLDTALVHDKGIFCLVRTTNSGAARMQLRELDTAVPSCFIAANLVNALNDERRHHWSADGWGPCGAVVGAADARSAMLLREKMPATMFLVPGYGFQGGAKAAVRACFTVEGRGALVNSARAVLYPKEGTVTEAAWQFVHEIRSILDGK